MDGFSQEPKTRLFFAFFLIVIGTVFLSETVQLGYKYFFGKYAQLTASVLRDGGTISVCLFDQFFVDLPIVLIFGFLLPICFYVWAVQIAFPLTKQPQFFAKAIWKNADKY